MSAQGAAPRRDAPERRALLALHRNHPDTQPGERYKWRAMAEARAQRDVLLAWAATKADEELLWFRNLGPVALAWIRDNQPRGIVQRAHTPCCWCGDHHREVRP